ncbi:serine hydrolase [Deinococcus sp. KNUC1210]|uniref:serine hydrolase n=1 Tax=Deinococcus sp. KNUC1210 TaxID=2917691 RepID=UPI001EF026DE|nr:serine hydrolase [Deinococcus sp. KNUC1210]ULH16242.1 serine hydrolase [Deinococcus sp. KNUC1210]
MRLSARPMRKKGRYVLLAAALLLAGQGLRTLHSVTSAPRFASVQRSVSPPIDSSLCLKSPAGDEAPPAPARLSGRLGLYVAVIDPVTLEPVRVVSRDPDGVYPLASAYKQSVLWALLRQKDAGALSFSETFDVSNEAQSLGDYPFDHSDVLTLATRMIQKSDNTATDLLHRRIGLKAVQDVADTLHLCHTRLILPTKDWWTAQAGLSPSFPGADAFAALSGPERLKAAQALDEDARTHRADLLQRRLDDYFDHRYTPQTDLGTQNVSTPAEFAHLIAAEFLHSGLSADAQATQRQLMALGFGGKRIQAPLTYFGGKGETAGGS